MKSNKEKERKNMYIDVRGPYPVLIMGLRTYTIEIAGATTSRLRDITIEQAIALLKKDEVMK